MFLFEEEKIRLYRGVKVLLHQLQTLSPILYTFSAVTFPMALPKLMHGLYVG